MGFQLTIYLFYFGEYITFQTTQIFFFEKQQLKNLYMQTGRVLVKNWATLNKLKIGPTVFFSHEKKKKKNVFAYLPLGDIFRS